MKMTYQEALDNFRAVSTKHAAVTLRYRAREIGDAEFLASRRELQMADDLLTEADRLDPQSAVKS